MSEYLTLYQQWKALQTQIKKSRYIEPDDYQKLKAKEREIIKKLNHIL